MITLVNRIKQENNIDESTKKKIDFICIFTNTTLGYFNDNEEIYVDNLSNKILIKDLENYINKQK